MAENEYARLVTKIASGLPTIPVSASHNNGDWIDTDIYEGELYIDSDTGKVYTRIGAVIVDAGAAGSVNIYNQDGALPTGATRTFNLDTGKLALLSGTFHLGTTGITGGAFRQEISASNSGLYIVATSGVAGSFNGNNLALGLISANLGLFSSSPRNVMRDDSTSIPSADPSCILELISTTKGFLLPRMTKTQRLAIASPSDGLHVFQIDDVRGVYWYDAVVALDWVFAY